MYTQLYKYRVTFKNNELPHVLAFCREYRFCAGVGLRAAKECFDTIVEFGATYFETPSKIALYHGDSNILFELVEPCCDVDFEAMVDSLSAAMLKGGKSEMKEVLVKMFKEYSNNL